MSKNRKSAAGRLYYTFGTIFLMAVITVCAMNFIKDSRLVNKPAVAAAKVNETGAAANAGSKSADSKDDGTKQPETKPTRNKANRIPGQPKLNRPIQSKPEQNPSIPVKNHSLFETGAAAVKGD